MLNLMQKIRPVSTDEDKQTGYETVLKMVEISKLTQEKGLLALDKMIEREDCHPFLKAAIPFITEAYEPELVAEMLTNLVLAGGFTGVELLCRVIMAEAVAAFQDGMNPAILKIALLSMLGEKYLQPRPAGERYA